MSSHKQSTVSVPHSTPHTAAILVHIAWLPHASTTALLSCNVIHITPVFSLSPTHSSKSYSSTFKSIHNLAPPISQNSSMSPHTHVHSGPPPPYSLLSLLPVSAPWGAGPSVALLPISGTHPP
ncbi:hypothetical protein WMY93_008735 [Mugilogobius chulae]|uniref:Uncharacterized protein n=1 Tax=Mugilogobius chulae TaxID=88201 RepID=A0AAW0PCZ7_9GOBI